VDIKKVLLVDDDADIRQVAGMSLTHVGGWEVSLASSGAEAIDIATEFRPDVILLDVMMPEMDGPTTYLELRKLDGFSETPIIFITAKVQRHEVERYLGLGASGCIGKPFDPMTLSKVISDITNDL
jgi:CheY-like chemotaxis protein